MEQNGAKLTVDSRHGVGIAWQGPATVNGRPWPVRNDTTLWIPAGHTVIEPGSKEPPLRMLDFNGNLRSGSVTAERLEFSYQSNARSIAVLDTSPRTVEIDGAVAHPRVVESGSSFVVILPRGQHLVQVDPTIP